MGDTDSNEKLEDGWIKVTGLVQIGVRQASFGFVMGHDGKGEFHRLCENIRWSLDMAYAHPETLGAAS